MSYIFLDESGDLGFNFSKQKTSKYFIISFLFVDKEQKRSTEKIIKKIYQNFSKAELNKHKNCLHCYKEKPGIRIKLLNLLNEKNIKIMAIYLNKSKVYSKLHDEKQVLYNYVTNILLDRIFSKRLVARKETIILIASKRETNKFLNENFKDYLEKQTQNNHNQHIEVKIKTPFEEKCLQVIDFVCWSLFRKYEHGDESYINIIQNKIIEENGLFQ